jgi:hypothetical protein
MKKLIILLVLIGIACLGIGIYSLNRPQVVYQNSIPVFTGNPEGLRLGTVGPGQTATLSYVSGRIVTNPSANWSSPIWGVPQEQTLAGWRNGVPHKDMWTDAIYVEMGTQRVPFRENGSTITVRNASTQAQDAWLKINDSRYWDDGGPITQKNSNNQGDFSFTFMVR